MVDGILIINKPAGLTSNDVVMRLKRKFKQKAVGHTGTLDPEVEGVLIVCLGRLTKLVPYLMADDKWYEGIISLGTSTTTEDQVGDVLRDDSALVVNISNDEINNTFAYFIGKITQTPPIYSAIKIKGKPLYEYARNNETVEIPSREIEIFDFYLSGNIEHSVKEIRVPFKANVSKGTYIRTLAVDFGKRLNISSHLCRLSRFKNGMADISRATPLDVIIDSVEPKKYLVNPEELLSDRWPKVQLDSFHPTVQKMISHGAKIRLEQFTHKQFAIVSKKGIVAFYVERDDGLYGCERGIFQEGYDESN